MPLTKEQREVLAAVEHLIQTASHGTNGRTDWVLCHDGQWKRLREAHIALLRVEIDALHSHQLPLEGGQE